MGCAAHAVIDDVLPPGLANEVAAAFPKDGRRFTRLQSFRERKLTTNDFDAYHPLLKRAAFALHAPQVVAAVSQLTGIADLLADPSHYAGGLSLMQPRDFLNPHIDNSHDSAGRLYRRVNLLLYLNPDWRDGDGGELELWDRSVRLAVAIAPRFNRLAIMITDRISWHSVAPVRRGQRRCISTYLFSEQSPTGQPYRHVTEFTGRPGQPLRRAVAAIDNAARTLARGMGARRPSDRSYRHAAIDPVAPRAAFD